MKFHQNISTRCKIINILVFREYVYKVKLAILGLNVNNFAMSKDILISLEFTLLNIIPKSLVTLHVLNFFPWILFSCYFSLLYFSYLQAPKSSSEQLQTNFSLVTVVIRTNRMWKSTNRKTSCSSLDTHDPKMIDTSFESPKCRL